MSTDQNDILNTPIADLPDDPKLPVGAVVTCRLMNWDRRENEKMGHLLTFSFLPVEIVDWPEGEGEPLDPKGYPFMSYTFFGQKGVPQKDVNAALKWLERFGGMEIPEDAVPRAVFEEARRYQFTFFVKEHNNRGELKLVPRMNDE